MRSGARLPWLAGVVLAAGCWAAPRPPGWLFPQAPAPSQQVDLAKVKRIELTAGHACGIYGGPRVEYKMVLCDGGPCRLTVTHGTNAGSIQAVTEYELPPETFAECRALLDETAFFAMRSAYPHPSA